MPYHAVLPLLSHPKIDRPETVLAAVTRYNKNRQSVSTKSGQGLIPLQNKATIPAGIPSTALFLPFDEWQSGSAFVVAVWAEATNRGCGVVSTRGGAYLVVAGAGGATGPLPATEDYDDVLTWEESAAMATRLRRR